MCVYYKIVNIKNEVLKFINVFPMNGPHTILSNGTDQPPEIVW